MILGYLKAILVGGLICAGIQVLIDRTALTPARILSGCVVLGVMLGALGVYEPFAAWAGAGATVPLPGFGSVLAKGMREAVAEKGALGILTGALTAASGGVGAAVVFAFLTALVFRPKAKN
jgi:stage V sporulation protein AE